MIYANVGPDGIIVFEPHADPGLNRLPVGSARDEDTERFKRAISGIARHARTGDFLIVPGVPEAPNQLKAVDALIRFRNQLELRMQAGDKA